MADYTKPTGTSGTLIIRDNGTNTIEFLIKNTSSQTHINHLRWTGTVNGVSVGGDKAVPPSSTVSLGKWTTVTTNQKVTLNIPKTNTIGLGGPTSISHNVTRQTVPPAPSQNAFSLITHTSARLVFTNNGTGGSTILEWQTSFGTNGSSIEGSGNSKFTSNGTVNFSNLQPGTTYYAWTRGRNASGWGPWSAVRSMTTLAGVKIKVSGAWVNAVPYVKDAGTWKPAIPYFKDGSSWKSTKA